MAHSAHEQLHTEWICPVHGKQSWAFTPAWGGVRFCTLCLENKLLDLGLRPLSEITQEYVSPPLTPKGDEQ